MRACGVGDLDQGGRDQVATGVGILGPHPTRTVHLGATPFGLGDEGLHPVP